MTSNFLLLSLSLNCWDYRYISPHLVNVVLGRYKLRASCMLGGYSANCVIFPAFKIGRL